MQIISWVWIKTEGSTFFNVKTFEIWKQYHTDVGIFPSIKKNNRIVELWPSLIVSEIEF